MLCLFQARTCISNLVCYGLFCFQWVHFVDYHYSNFLFIRHITLISSQPVFTIVLLNAEYLVEKQQILILLSLTWACLNSSALEVSMLRIAALMQFVTMQLVPITTKDVKNWKWFLCPAYDSMGAYSFSVCHFVHPFICLSHFTGWFVMMCSWSYYLDIFAGVMGLLHFHALSIFCERNFSEVVSSKAFIFGGMIGHDM
jgi:hypothetical protein